MKKKRVALLRADDVLINNWTRVSWIVDEAAGFLKYSLKSMLMSAYAQGAFDAGLVMATREERQLADPDPEC